ncbi:MAG: DUF5067 domain-containing protein [Oscillospiraceae bacterium]|nr:DUF5067 domain-containing protein [Oscillospiraceae bacterium]
MKKNIVTILFALLVLSACTLCGCATKEGAGKYRATFMRVSKTDFPPEEFLEGGAQLLLRGNGHGTLTMGGAQSALTWQLDGHAITVQCEGSTTEGTLYGDMIYLVQVLGTEMDLAFAKEGAAVNGDGKAESKDGSLGDYRVMLSGAEEFDLNDAEDGKKGLRVYYDFTNNSDDTVMSGAKLDLEARQDGEVLKSGSAQKDVREYNNRVMYVRPGCSIRAVQELSFDPAGGPVELKVSARHEDQAHVITQTYDPSALPGAPAEEFVPAPVADPKWTEGLEAEGDLDYLHVKALRAETLEEGGEARVRVYVSLTNIEDDSGEIIPSEAVAVYVYQDGLELKNGMLEQRSDSDELYYKAIPEGGTVEASVVFRLLSHDPVEVELTNVNGEPVYGARFELP